MPSSNTIIKEDVHPMVNSAYNASENLKRAYTSVNPASAMIVYLNAPIGYIPPLALSLEA